MHQVTVGPDGARTVLLLVQPGDADYAHWLALLACQAGPQEMHLSTVGEPAPRSAPPTPVPDPFEVSFRERALAALEALRPVAPPVSEPAAKRVVRRNVQRDANGFIVAIEEQEVWAMPTVAFTKIHAFAQDIGRKVHNLHTDTLKVMLTNTAPVAATSAVKADLTEIAAGSGYTAGGSAVGSQSYSQSSGTGSLACTCPTFTASGGSIGPFRYLVLYNDTSTSDSLIGYLDYGSSITLNDGESLTTTFPAAIETIGP